MMGMFFMQEKHKDEFSMSFKVKEKCNKRRVDV